MKTNRMRRFAFGTVLLLLSYSLINCAGNSQNNKDIDWAQNALIIASEHAKNMYPDVIANSKLPRSIENGFVSARSWTSGFYPGILWYLYGYTNDISWKERAEKITPFLEEEQYNTRDHDVGFRIYCSYGNGWILTKNEEYKKIIIQAANSLSTRFNEKTGTIQSWSVRPERDWKFPVIVDNMMNLELLFEAAKLSGDKRLANISVKHALTTMKYHYRPDYSCPHVSDYDSETGEFRKWDWNNGNDDPETATWSRGQSWGLYGYTLMYRETKDEQYLVFAENIANFLINHPNMPEDMIPYWDYAGTEKSEVRDASAGAIMASALLELSLYSKKGEEYFAVGEKMLQSLASPIYLSKPGTNGNFVIKHATSNYLRGVEVDNSLIYADYYFIEGLIRYLRHKNNKPMLPEISYN